MIDEYKLTPNSYLGDVHWSMGCFYGTSEPIIQDMLGMLAAVPIPDRKFLDTRVHHANYLWDFFIEREHGNGKLALILKDSDMGGDPIATIETHFKYGEEITDEDFLRLIDDFVAYARTRPIVDSKKREGAEITDEDIERIKSQETNMERAFWDSLDDTVTTEVCGLPHYLWIESLMHQEESD